MNQNSSTCSCDHEKQCKHALTLTLKHHARRNGVKDIDIPKSSQKTFSCKTKFTKLRSLPSEASV